MKNYSLKKLCAALIFLASTNIAICQEESIKSSDLGSLKNVEINSLKSVRITNSAPPTLTAVDVQTTSETTNDNEVLEIPSPIIIDDPKTLAKDDHIANLFIAFDQISRSEEKLLRMYERLATIPTEEINQVQINELVEKYNNDKDRAKRKVVSIEHLLKSESIVVEIPNERFEQFSDSVKQHILSANIYGLTN